MQRIELLYIECVNTFAVIFADYQLHSLLGSVGKLTAETNVNFPALPFNHISGICKNLADTWPVATRVLSRGRKREDPGNEVEASIVFGDMAIVSLFLLLFFSQSQILFGKVQARSNKSRLQRRPQGHLICIHRHVTSRNQGTFSREEKRGPWERGCSYSCLARDVITFLNPQFKSHQCFCLH